MTTAAPSLTVLHLKGTEAQMGHQHGALTHQLGGRDELAAFYPSMAARMLALRTPHAQRSWFRGALQPFLASSARRLHRARLRRHPALVDRSAAVIEAARLPGRLTTWMNVMDVFQNSIGWLARLRVPQLTGLRLTGIPMCSSLAVWDAASADGTLRHARNFDFPGIGLWDARPTVVFCSPVGGLRYGFVTSLGVDVPGVTGFNEAGLTITAHTRMHVDIDADGTSIGDLGHEIIRRARTVTEAVQIAEELGSSSTWGLLVSSAHEHDAVLIETTGKKLRVTRPDGDQHQACTNRYRSPELSPGEVLPSAAFALDSDARFTVLDRAGHRGGLTPEELQQLLASAEDPYADVNDGADRITGSCIASPLTVQSVVVEPEAGQIRVGAGRAPTAEGPWLTIPWSWDGDARVVAEHAVPTTGPGSALDQARASFVEATRRDLDGGTAAEVRGLLHQAAALAPREPHLQFLGALAALGERDSTTAEERLHRGLDVQSAPFRRAQLLRWAAKVAEAQGATAGAAELRGQLDALGPAADSVRALVAADRAHPATARSLARVVPDLLLVDA